MSPRSAETKPNGVVAAAILAAGVGVVITGLMIHITWARPAGPLSGKTGVGVIVWLIAWVVLHNVYRGRDVEFGKIMRWAWVLFIMGFMLTFPPAFELIVKTIHGK